MEPTQSQNNTQELQIAELKKKFLEYYRKIPIKKYAASSIGRDEDTTRVWEKADSDFADHILKAKAAYLLDNIKLIKNKAWIIERLYRDEFYSEKRIEHGGEIVVKSKQEIIALIYAIATGAIKPEDAGVELPDVGNPDQQLLESGE